VPSLSSNYERGKIAELRAKEWLESKCNENFAKKNLPVGTKLDGTSAIHSFDLVSEDNQIVAEVKSHRLTKSGKTPSGKVSDTYHACYMLEKVNARKKLLILTDLDFFELFKRYSNGKICNQIEMVLLNETCKTSLLESPTKIHDRLKVESSDNSDFAVFWSGLTSWLEEKQTIENWTAVKGLMGEDFEAGPVVGNYMLVYPHSALNVQKVPKKDFKFVYEKWAGYKNGDFRRGELAKKSRFTKYTISIIRQYRSHQ